MALFQHSVIKKYLQELDKASVKESFVRFTKYFNDPKRQQNIRDSKEEQFQEGFLRSLFVDILGYTLYPEPNFNLLTEQKNEKDSKKADGAILLNGATAPHIIAVIELKGTDTTDLSKVENQAFSYKNNQKGCVYVITSNFEKLRFYIDNAIDFEEFNLFNLTEERFQLLFLCLSKDNLLNGIPQKIKEASISKEEQITKKLYADYSAFKRSLFQNIIKINPKFDKLILFKKTQKLLDRFLFVFFAEDRLLLPPNSIREIVKQWEQLKELDNYIPLYDRFIKYFEYMNVGFKGKKYEVFAYNGGLFAPDEVLDKIKIDDTVLHKHAIKLSDYDFDTEIDVNILGHIFEHSLNEIEEIQSEIEGKELDKSRTKRKKDGIFYTPKYITKYIVDKTIGAICVEKKKELGINDEEIVISKRIKLKKELIQKIDTYRAWLLKLTICDPACGSGAFLNQALDYLINEHRKLDELKARITNSPIIFSDIEKSVLENNIFGVDLNEEAVEIAKLSLWLKTAHKGRKLSVLSSNIKCGNSLIDDKAIAKEKSFNWKKEFPEIFANGGFDVIIGNPPYVRQEMLSKEDKIYLSEHFKAGNGIADLYVYFYDRAIEILKQNGYLGFITPNKFYKTKYGKELRQLLKNFRIIELIDFFELKVFEDASTDAQVLILEKNSKTKIIKYSPIKSIENFKDNNYSTIEINTNDLSDDIWVFNNSIELSIINKMKNNSISLIDYSSNSIYRGITTGLNEAFILDELTKNRIISDDPKSAEIIKPYISGVEINKWFVDFQKKYIITTFPSKSIEIQNYPGIKKYLENFGKKRLEQSGEEGSRKKTPNKWFEIQDSTAYFKEFEVPKIIYIHTAVNHCFYYDEEGYYINNSSYLISNVDKFLSVWLNSKIFSFYKKLNFVAYGDSAESGRAKLDYNKMVNVPIPNITKDKKQPFIQKADTMHSLNKELHLLKTKFIKLLKLKFIDLNISSKIEDWTTYEFSAFLKELAKQKLKLSLSEQSEWLDLFEKEKEKAFELQNKINKTDKEIDHLIFELYKFSKEEINIIETAE